MVHQKNQEPERFPWRRGGQIRSKCAIGQSTNNTIHSQGAFDETGKDTDFAIVGPGFFAVDNNGIILYTRNGSFNIDEEGYLFLKGAGRVQGEFGDIYIGTDKFEFREIKLRILKFISLNFSNEPL